MSLTLYFRPSFERCLKNLTPLQAKIVGLILESMEVYYSSDCNLDEAKKIAPRFFYKQLRRPYYEAGVESHIRVIIRREKNVCLALLAGNHDQIRQFLSNL